MEKFQKYAGTVALVILAIQFVLPFFGGPSFGASGTRYPNGLSADSTSPAVGQVRGATFTSTGLATLASAVVTGSFTQSTTNAATTTAALGCIQTTATSTATPIRFVIGNTQAASTTYQGTNSNFTVLAQYGSCPI